MSYFVEKPWGSEEFIYEDNGITVKIIRSFKGPLSIQIHPEKDEIFTLLDFDSSIISNPHISFATPKSFETCMQANMSKYYISIGHQFNCPRRTLHQIPQGLTILEYSKGPALTLRVKDFYGRGVDTDEIKELFRD